jgi:hypothetical protein
VRGALLFVNNRPALGHATAWIPPCTALPVMVQTSSRKAAGKEDWVRAARVGI